MPADLEWLIVGGGVHGTYLSHVLLAACGVPADRLRVVDPHDVPLARFTTLADAVGFRYLRSPSVHHLDLDPYSLRTFITRRRIPEDEAYAAPYDRPAWTCFQAHTAGVIRRARLQAVRTTATVTRVRSTRGGFAAETDAGVLRTRRVILAVGGTGVPAWPDWAPRDSDRVRHVFALPAPVADSGSLLVIGGGISAVQFACREAEHGRVVTLIRRHDRRVFAFDSDPAWMGAKAMDPFLAEPCPAARRAAIRAARHRGSMPPDEQRRLERLVTAGRLHERRGDPVALTADAEGVQVRLADGDTLSASFAVLATGFDQERPGGLCVDHAIADLGLPTAPCGYPLVSRSLEWGPDLYVTGPLAELELGPTARNIAGARAAGKRLTDRLGVAHA